MIWNLLKIKPKRSLGIDVGTASIKIVEISWFGKEARLGNFGELSILNLEEKLFRNFKKDSLSSFNVGVAKIIQAILEEAKIETKLANFSIPDFSTFFTFFELPLMTERELPEAIKYTAREHIPLPLSEVTLDWQIIEGGLPKDKATKLKILLVSVPNQIVNQYQEIAKKANLKLPIMEAEAFALNRALIKEDDKDKVVVLVDIGARSTTISIIDKKVLKSSYSIDVSGNEFTFTIAKSLNVDYNKAEAMKKKYGVIFNEKQGVGEIKDIGEILIPLLDLILTEIKKISQTFMQSEKRKIDKYILAGGSVFLPGLKNYCAQKLEQETVIADSFSGISYPVVLESTLKEMGPSFATAVGLALRRAE